jgi:ribosome assembly protein YihI (activator of Der GTPase)
MPARAEYRDRDATEVAVLDALVGRAEDGMTVLELRSHVDADIDRIETALTELKADGLIEVERDDETLWLYPHDAVVPDPEETTDEEPDLVAFVRQLVAGNAGGESLLERLRRLFR